MKNKLAGWMAVAALLAGPGAAWAVPVEWTLAPTTLPGGPELSGSFVYDADTDTYSNVNIVRTASSLPSATFTARQKTPFFGGYTQFFPAAVTGSFAGVPLLLIDSLAFPNAGGSVSHMVFTGDCRNSTCSSVDIFPSGRTVEFAGKVVAPPAVPGAPDATVVSIPTLSEWGLIGLSSLMGLAALLHARRRREDPRLSRSRA